MKDRVLWTMATVLAVAAVTPLAFAQSSSTPPPASSAAAPTDPTQSTDQAPIGTGVPSWIQEKSTDSQTQLQELESSLSLSKDKTDKLKADIEAMKGDRDKQNAALIAAAARVKAAELEIANVQNKIGDLIVQELDTRGRLDGADASISNVLAALERISQNPPPAIIVDPSDALGSARSAILISAILPQLKAKADEVTTALNRLNDIKAAAQAEETNLKANFDVLEEEQLRIATLIQAQ